MGRTLRLILGSRKSDLARLQAGLVGAALKRVSPGLEIQYDFRESLGDLEQELSLAASKDKGLFTRDFRADILSGRIDAAVHSWKDLPLELPGSTLVLSVLPRADARDVLLVKKDFWRKKEKSLSILTSSPRRAWSLTRHLPGYLPRQNLGVETFPVRGNIPTRLRKLLESESGGLVVAKAALDRLLGSQETEFQEARTAVETCLKECLWMVLPLSWQAAAAAQGGLAVEIRPDRKDLLEIFESIEDPSTRECIHHERKILGELGGGCQKGIGVTCLERSWGQWIARSGLTDSGEDISSLRLHGALKPPPVQNANQIWPDNQEKESLWERIPIPEAAEKIKNVCGETAFVVTRNEALPKGCEPEHERLIWTSGLDTWKKLAARGVWVNGSFEGRGEDEEAGCDLLVGRKIKWLRLTHEQAGGLGAGGALATYGIALKENIPDLSGKTHFFWSSPQTFEKMMRLHPGKINGYHASGPGLTRKHLLSRLPDPARLFVALNAKDWTQRCLP